MNLRWNAISNVEPLWTSIGAQPNLVGEICERRSEAGPLVPAADVLASHGVINLAFLKIDCEGCEYHADLPKARIFAVRFMTQSLRSGQGWR